MSARAWRLAALLVLSGLWLVVLTLAQRTASIPTASAAAAPVVAVQNVWTHLPTDVSSERPLRVLVVLHGMGGNGEQFAHDFLPHVDRARWLVIAPTIDYGDWRDPEQIRQEDPALINWLADYLERLPTQVERPLRSRVYLLGHSRGAQLAHRFALFHPDRVAAVAALSAGTYTLPAEQAAFPYGVGDLDTLTGARLDPTRVKRIGFWVGVGSRDDDPAELPREWDPYIGTNRVERARSFQRALRDMGADPSLQLFSGAQHGLTPAMRQDACAFLESVPGEQ